MAGAFVQVAGANSSTVATDVSASVTLSGTTANNLLVLALSVSNGGDVFTDPSGWTKILQCPLSGFANGVVYYKIADGSETNVTVAFSNAGEWAATVCEYSGLATSSVLEASGENETYISSDQTAGASINSGSATPSTANGMAIACHMGPDERDANESELSIDNSYTINDFEQPMAGNNAIVAIASKAYTTTAAQSPNWSTSTGAAWKAYTTIAVFKEAAAGGLTGIRNPMGGPIVLRNPLGRM